MKKFKTIKEFYDAVQNGDIEESKLEIILDNDETFFYYGEGEDNEITIEESNGHYDIEPLYKILFPGSDVQWC